MAESRAWVEEQGAIALRRLFPRIESRFRERTEAVEWEAYTRRLRRHFPRLFERLHGLYGDDHDFYYHL
ncbi:MAG: amylosucrase, partial [Gammaproteobacteria bacterium]